jgi:hypothetical protein
LLFEQFNVPLVQAQRLTKESLCVVVPGANETNIAASLSQVSREDNHRTLGRSLPHKLILSMAIKLRRRWQSTEYRAENSSGLGHPVVRLIFTPEESEVLRPFIDPKIAHTVGHAALCPPLNGAAVWAFGFSLPGHA